MIFIHLLSLFFSSLSLSLSSLCVSLSFNLFLFVILHLFQYFKMDKIDVVFVPHNIDTKRNTFKEILKKLRTEKKLVRKQSGFNAFTREFLHKGSHS